jgi:hypothetical protein
VARLAGKVSPGTLVTRASEASEFAVQPVRLTAALGFGRRLLTTAAFS